MPKSVVAVEWRQFIDSSSVRGLKRTTSSPTLFQRVFWICFLLCSVAAMLAQAYLVILNYIGLKDVSMLRSRSYFGQSTEFPAVTLCNRNMMNPRGFLGQMTIANYSDRIRDLARRSSSGKDILLSMDNLHGFYSQLPPENMTQYSIDFKYVAILINLVYNNGTRNPVHTNFKILDEFQKSRGQPPGPNGPAQTDTSIVVKQFYHPVYSLCNTIHLNMSTDLLGKLYALRIDLALANPLFNTSSNPELRERRGFLEEALSTQRNFVVALHDINVYPRNLVAQKGITVNTGGITSIRFSTQHFSYRQCKSDTKISHGNLGYFKHTPEDCANSILESVLKQRLNCTDDPFAWPSMRSCLKIPDSNNPVDMLSRMRDYVTARQGVFDSSEAAEDCNVPSCQETHYGMSSAYSPWLINDFQWKWAIHKMLYSGSGMDEYLANADNDSHINDPTYPFNNYSDIMRTILIYRENSFVTINEEVELTTVSNLISSVGGIMSIYVGITFTLVAELLDLSFGIVRALLQRKREVSKAEKSSDRVFTVRSGSVQTLQSLE